MGGDYTHDPHAKYRNKGLTFAQPGDVSADEAGRTYDTHKYIEERYPDIAHGAPDPLGEDFGEDFARPRMKRDRTEEDVKRDMEKDKARRHSGALDPDDHRWVALESARFVAAHTDTLDDNHELATRAHEYAAMKTSTFTPARSAAICEQFVARVASLGRQSYRPPSRVASVQQYADFDDQAIYLC